MVYNFWMLFAYFFFLCVLHLLLLLLQRFLWFPSHVCTHHYCHKDLNLASESWIWFDYLWCVFPFIIVYFNPIIFVLNLDGWWFVLSIKFTIFWYSVLAIHIYNYNNNQSSSIWFVASFLVVFISFLISPLISSLVPHKYPLRQLL